MDPVRTDPAAPPVPAARAAPASPAPDTQEFGACDQCGAPVDDRQRYCVSCGVRRKHVYDPAARYMATATSRSRSAARAAHGPASARRRIMPGLGTAAVLVAIPLAVGLGVLVGRLGNGGDDKLLAALRAQKPLVLTTGGGGAATAPADVAAATNTSAALTSDFSLQSGYAVDLQVLPARGTDQGSVSRAEAHLRSRGAGSLGLITQTDFRITPSPPRGAYVIYSGQYTTSAAADQALAKLKPRFPAAKVISVQSASGRSGGKVLNTTAYGSATQVTGYKPTPAAIAISKQAINKTAHEIGNNYVQAQKGLPDQTVLP
jgi:hypothetical protein